MTPTLLGRIETRIFIVLFVGVPWTLLIAPLLPTGSPADGVSASRISDLYKVTFTSLALVALLGVVLWEPLYHLLQQFRWEKDWPAMFILLEGINEGIVVYWVLRSIVTTETPVGTAAFMIHFSTTWILLFLFVHGPIRVPFLRWRFRGGRII